MFSGKARHRHSTTHRVKNLRASDEQNDETTSRNTKLQFISVFYYALLFYFLPPDYYIVSDPNPNPGLHGIS